MIWYFVIASRCIPCISYYYNIRNTIIILCNITYVFQNWISFIWHIMSVEISLIIIRRGGWNPTIRFLTLFTSESVYRHVRVPKTAQPPHTDTNRLSRGNKKIKNVCTEETSASNANSRLTKDELLFFFFTEKFYVPPTYEILVCIYYMGMILHVYFAHKKIIIIYSNLERKNFILFFFFIFSIHYLLLLLLHMRYPARSVSTSSRSRPAYNVLSLHTLKHGYVAFAYHNKICYLGVIIIISAWKLIVDLKS